MWSGLLPAGVTESELSGEEEEGESAERPTPEPVTEHCRQKFLELQRKRCEQEAESSCRERRRKQRRRGRKRQKTVEEAASSAPALDTLQKYFGVNDHLEPPVCQKVLKKSRLEESLDAAVVRGDVGEAEQLSDRLATRELAVKVTRAAACHRYIQAREQEAASQEGPRKRKNLPWGFEAKKRWETKSNMGYM